jgi:hypothetical protein
MSRPGWAWLGLTTFALAAGMNGRADAASFSVVIDVGGFIGSYSVSGVAGAQVGSKTLSLAPGTYTFGNFVDSFTFVVDANGNVTSNRDAAAFAAGNALHLRNATVSIDPAGYGAVPGFTTYDVNGLGRVSGPSSFTNLAGMNSDINVSGGAHIARYFLAADGTITLVDGFTSAVATSNQITFQTVPMTIDPGAYGSRPAFNTIDPTGGQRSNLPQTFGVIVDVSFGVPLSGGALVAKYHVHSNGDVVLDQGQSSVDASAPGEPSKITFRTIGMTIDPASATTTSYDAVGGQRSAFRQSFPVIPDVEFSVGISSGPQIARYKEAADGTVTITSGFASATAAPGLLTFRNVPITIDPAAYPGVMEPLGGGRAPGVQTFTIVPEVHYPIRFTNSSPTITDYTESADGTIHLFSGASNATTAPNKITMRNLLVHVQPSNDTAAWAIDLAAGGGSGPRDVVLIPGFSYSLRSSGLTSTFFLGDTCTLDPSRVTVGGTDFALSCGPIPPPIPADQEPPTAAIDASPPVSSQRTLTVTGSVRDNVGLQSASFTVNGVAQGGALAIGADGRVSATLTLAEGANTIVLRAIDLAGNVGATSTDVVVDTVPPVATIVSPANDVTVGSSPLAVVVHVDDRTSTIVEIAGQEVPVAAGTGLATATVALVEGGNTITAIARDAAGNRSAPITLDVLLDSSAPIVDIDVADGMRIGPLEADLLPITLHVDAISSSTVELSTGEQFAVPAGGGVVQAVVPLVPGRQTFSITVVNAVGRASTLSPAIIYDVTPPAGRVVVPAAAARGVVDIAVEASDDLTDVAQVSIALDRVLVPAQRRGDVWTAQLDTTRVGDGPYDVVATIVDGVGNSSSAAAPLVVDNTAPAVRVTSPTSGQAVRSRVLVSASAEDTTSGVASISLAINGASVGSCSSSPCEVELDTTTLPDGPFLVAAFATDVAGNTSARAESTAIADNSAPASFLVSPLSGAVLSASVTVSIDVSAPDFVSAECFVGDTSLGATSDRHFTQTVDLSTSLDGPIVVTCTATDQAGNTGRQSAEVTVDRWTESLVPRALNVNGNGKWVTMSVRGPGNGLLAASTAPITLVAPGGSPVPLRESERFDDHVDLRFDREAFSATVKAGLTSGAIVPGRPFAVKLLAGTHLVGTDTMTATRGGDK